MLPSFSSSSGTTSHRHKGHIPTMETRPEMKLQEMRDIQAEAETMRTRGSAFKRIGRWLLVRDRETVMVFFASWVMNIDIREE